jgi:hypothetical protein
VVCPGEIAVIEPPIQTNKLLTKDGMEPPAPHPSSQTKLKRQSFLSFKIWNNHPFQKNVGFSATDARLYGNILMGAPFWRCTLSAGLEKSWQLVKSDSE